jgi:GTP-binding protein
MLKRNRKKVVVAANKADTEASIPDTSEFYKLGLGEVYPVSASNGRQVGDLLDAMVKKLPEAVDEAEADDAVKIAIVGRPNVGKSSLFNAIIGEKHQIVSDIPGTTRDSVDSLIEINGKRFNFIDTAGLRKKARYPDIVEYFSSIRSIRALERSDIALVVLDCEDGVTMGDIRIAGNAAELGRGLVFIANKWDLVKGVEQATFNQSVYDKATGLKYVRIIYTDSLKGKGMDKVIEGILEVEQQMKKRIGTGELNSFFEEIVNQKHPPARAGKFIKFYYITQAESSPPTFVIFCNYPKLVENPYRRYVENRIREKYGFIGAPLSLIFKLRK